jgi:DNA-directed RNA polymerase subunit H
MVPEHRLVSDLEAERILKKFGITKEQLPKIKLTDPAIKVLEATQKEKEGIREGMIVEITRNSKTSEKFTAYRLITR